MDQQAIVEVRRESSARAYRRSWITLVLALISVVMIPVVIIATDDGYPGWDQLPEQLNVVFGGLLIGFLLLSVSFSLGLLAVKERKVVLFWVIPSGVLLVLVSVYLLALAAGAAVGPFWKAGWL